MTIFLRLKRLIEDFREFVLVRRIARYAELDNSHKSLITGYDKDKEVELNEIILTQLCNEMLKGEVSAEYVRGFRSALTGRIALLSYKSKFNNNN